MKRIAFLLMIGLMALIGRAQEQMAPGKPIHTDEMPLFYYQAVNFAASDSMLSRVDIPYRVDNQFFVSVKNSDPAFPHPFIRRGEIYLDLLDKDGVSKARKVDRFEIGEQSSENSNLEKKWHEGIASFTVPPGEYSITFEVNDLESQRKVLDRNRKIIAQSFSGEKLLTSTPMFILPVTSSSSTISPLTYGGNILYGSGASLYVELFSSQLTRDPVTVEYTITQQEVFRRDSRPVKTDTVQNLQLLPEGSLLVQQGNAPPAYQLSTTSRKSTAAFVLPLDADKWPLRPFVIELKIRQGKLETNVEHQFRMIWPDMPSSLRDIDFALDALRHLTSKDELDSLEGGSTETRLKHLEEYWQKLDPTPGTNFNERMTEYYRRVDYTMRSFSSMKAPDGYKTDRGKIYILYGPPTKSERLLDPNEGYTEIWTYEKQNKKFVFADKSKSGNYSLISTQSL